VNQAWQQHVHLPGYKSAFGVSEEIEEAIQTELLDLLDHEHKTNARDPLSILFTSVLHGSNTKPAASSLAELRTLLSLVDCIKTPRDVGHLIGTLNRIQSDAPLSLVINNDTYDSSSCSIYIYDVTLGIPNDDVYTEDPALLAKYRDLLRKLGEHLYLEHMESVATTGRASSPFC
jgi:predicted metalloendopeptidase